jgi:hypothetical protein
MYNTDMTENQGKTEKISAERIATAYQEYLEKPELRKKMVNNLSTSLDSDEKIEKFAKESNVDSEELKKTLRK